MASAPAALIQRREGHSCPVLIESAEATSGRLGAVLAASRGAGLTRLGPHGPWLVTDLPGARQVLTDPRSFDFPTTVSRTTDLSASEADTRTGHHVYAALTPAQVERGSRVFVDEWREAVAAAGTSRTAGTFDAMQALRRPVARATCAAALDGLARDDRDAVADHVLAWIDALGPVISARRSPGRWSRVRRAEDAARRRLEGGLAGALARCGVDEPPERVATFLAAGIQVPIAAGSWLLVLLAAHPDGDLDPDDVVWETLRMAPPTWVTARVTAAPVELAGHQLASGEVVLVSPLLLGRLADLVPDTTAGVADFRPDRWRGEGRRPGSWLPFGAGAHACPGRTLGLRLLRDLAGWATGHELSLPQPVSIDQSRGIVPAPAHVTFSTPTQ